MAKTFGDGIPIPNVIDPPESMRMTLCIPKNRDHMSAFFGALYQLTLWDSWQEDDAHNGAELAKVWWRYYLSWDRVMSDLDCEDGMNDCCVEPAITRRVNPVTGNLEQSVNGGATWTPAAGGVQSMIVQPVPPVTSGVAGTKCDAATNVAGQVDVWIDQVSNDFTTATTILEFATAVLVAILAAVFAALSLGALTAAEALVIPTIMAACTAAFGAGKAAFDAYWTTEVKDAILCAAYCNIGDDGSFTAMQFSTFWGKVNSDLPPSPAKMLFMGFLSSVGKEGLNAMAASGMAADSDCADCDCFDDCASTWEIFGDDPTHFHGTIDERGEGYIIASSGSGGYLLIRTPNKDACCLITSIENISGRTDLSPGWTDCGVEPVEGAPQHGGIFGYGSYCVNYFQQQAPGIFTIKLTFEECP